MDKEELAKWMKAKGIDEQLRVWIANDIVGHGDYTILEDLSTTGKVNITITLNAYGQLTFAKTELAKTVKTVETPMTTETEKDFPIISPTFTKEPESPKTTTKLVKRRRSIENP